MEKYESLLEMTELHGYPIFVYGLWDDEESFCNNDDPKSYNVIISEGYVGNIINEEPLLEMPSVSDCENLLQAYVKKANEQDDKEIDDLEKELWNSPTGTPPTK